MDVVFGSYHCCLRTSAHGILCWFAALFCTHAWQQIKYRATEDKTRDPTALACAAALDESHMYRQVKKKKKNTQKYAEIPFPYPPTIA